MIFFSPLFPGFDAPQPIQSNSFMRDQIYAVLRTLGRMLVLRRVIAGEYDPETGFSGDVSQDFNGIGAIVSYSNNTIGTGLVEKQDRKAILSAVGLEETPSENDLIITQNETLRVIRVQTIFENLNAIAHICQTRP